ncbi:MAG TPA: hypothetical protein VK742_21160 [Candidatus Sulfotelmatobacter sp.]|jgi:hypothetical protein|nr:hypothetical protein [Candidatus Sulfotelmatobacter sp.]
MQNQSIFIAFCLKQEGSSCILQYAPKYKFLSVAAVALKAPKGGEAVLEN